MITEVTMYRGTCDTCGKDNDDEYYAWADRGGVSEMWWDSDEFAFDDGRLYHRECLPDEFCPIGARHENYAHTPNEDGTVCDECEKPIPATATA